MFSLDKFLANYKPKNLEAALRPYSKCKKLQFYTRLTSENIDELVPGHTYIKYIKQGDALMDKHYEDHIKNGGLLLEGGVFNEGVFEKISRQNKKWSHLFLKFLPYDVLNEDREVIDRYEGHLSYIKINNYYIYFRVLRDVMIR